MKRVLLVNGSSKPLKCGVGYYGDVLAQHLAKTCDVHLLTTTGLGSDQPEAGLHHTNNWKIASLPKIIKTIRAINPDVVHIQYPANGYKRQLGINLLSVALRVSRFKSPVIITLHEYYGSRLLGKIRNIITVTGAEKIIVSNQYDLDKLPRIFKKRLQVIPIGSNIVRVPKNREVFESFMRVADLATNKPTLVYFGFINESKGVDTLVNSAKDINTNILLLAELKDDDAYHNKIRSLIANANAEGAHIHVAGFLDDTKLSQILQECDIFALPQPLPLTAKSGTAIAAVQHGLVVVSSASSQSKYNLPYLNGDNCILLTSITPTSFAAACNNLLTNQSKNEQIKTGASKLSKQFEWSNIAKKHTDLYDSIS